MLDFISRQIKMFYSLPSWMPKINIKLLTTLVCLSFVGSSIYGNFDDLASQVITNKEIIWLLGGVFFSFISIIVNAYAWKLLINNIGCYSNSLNIMKLFINTNIFKYFPGGILHFVSRYKSIRLYFSTEKSLESILLEPLLMLVAGLIFVPLGSGNLSFSILCWSSTLVFLNGFRGFIIKNLRAMKANIFNSKGELNTRSLFPDDNNISMKVFYPYKPLFVESLFIIVRYFGFLCCINAFSIGSLVSHSELISCFSLAWIIGLIVPAAPGGMGVFESAILFRLGSEIPEGPLLAALLCYRLVVMLSDILSALIYPFKRLLRI